MNIIVSQVKFRIVYYEDEATLSHSSGGLAMFLCLYHLGTRLDHACIANNYSQDAPLVQKSYHRHHHSSIESCLVTCAA